MHTRWADLPHEEAKDIDAFARVGIYECAPSVEKERSFHRVR